MKSRLLLRLCGILLIVVLLCPFTAAARQENVPDVPWRPWYADAVDWAIANGILNKDGKVAKRFRAEIAAATEIVKASEVKG